MLELPNLKERDFVHTRIKGTPDMIPKYPSLFEMLSAKVKNTSLGSGKINYYQNGFRIPENGNGKCMRCLEFKTSSQFASKTGYVCKSCALQAKRIRRKKT